MFEKMGRVHQYFSASILVFYFWQRQSMKYTILQFVEINRRVFGVVVYSNQDGFIATG